jgi:hypothetical protein
VTALRSWWAKLLLAGVLPLAVAAAWIPLRDQVPNADLALLLILTIAMVGWLIGPSASLIAAVVGAVAFDVMDARPYGTLTMSQGGDIITALILLVTGLVVGAGAARLARYRRREVHRSDALAVVMEASRLVATGTGEDRHLITAALRAELRRALQLVDCEFHAEPPNGARPSVARDGSLVGLLPSTRGYASPQIDLPVWCQGEVVAHYRLTLGDHVPSKDELRVALSLADQAGAAMANPGERPQPPLPPQPARLRLLLPGGARASQPASATGIPVAPPVDDHPPPAGESHRAGRAAGLVS